MVVTTVAVWKQLEHASSRRRWPTAKEHAVGPISTRSMVGIGRRQKWYRVTRVRAARRCQRRVVRTSGDAGIDDLCAELRRRERRDQIRRVVHEGARPGLYLSRPGVKARPSSSSPPWRKSVWFVVSTVWRRPPPVGVAQTSAHNLFPGPHSGIHTTKSCCWAWCNLLCGSPTV
jgi:hypothetical protein